ncbi:arginine--tRNA ligase, partial [bacterium DOLZORAL124_64_63]
EAGLVAQEPSAKALSLLKEEAEWNLVRELIRLPLVIVSAARAREPHRLTAYLAEVAELFHKFYHNCPVVKILADEPELAQSRVQLSLITRHVLRVVMDIIGVEAPEIMEEKVGK